MKKTFNQIRSFNVAANYFLSLDNNNINTKLGYAIQKVSTKSISPILETYNEELGFIAIDNCAVDDNDVMLYNVVTDDQGNESKEWKYTKEGLKNKLKEEKEFVKEWNEKEFDIDPYIATSLPKTLDKNLEIAFSGFVIKEEKLEVVAD